MARTLEQLDGLLTKMADTIDEQAAQIKELTDKVNGVDAMIGHKPSNAALEPDHVLSPSRRGLADYEQARTQLLTQKAGQVVELVHLGKPLKVNYAQGRELLHQAGII